MDRIWSLLFLAVPVLGIVIVIGAANNQLGLANSWLPNSIGPRTEGIDYLFNGIHLLLGFVFLLTGLILSFSLWRFRASAVKRASHISQNHWLEFLWTAVPAGILIFLALHQLPYWQANKERHPLFLEDKPATESNHLPPTVRAVAFQYGWRFVYPGVDQQFDTRDDIISENLLVLPSHEELVMELVSEDVIHSFAINQLRLKQDIVPGLTPRIWFEIVQNGEWEIICMELCGWGHYRMAARLRVVSRLEFELWKERVLTQRHY